MSRDFFRKFGNRVKYLRLHQGLSQEELGFEAEISGSFIGMIERAEKDVSLSKVYNIAKALGVQVKDLF